MTLQRGTSELLAALPQALGGVTVRVLDEPPAVPAAAGAVQLVESLPAGCVVADVPQDAAALVPLVRSLLDVVAAREQLEGDMLSVLTKFEVMQEQLFSYAEELPRISSGDELQIASGGAEACQRATKVRHVVYLGYLAGKNCCEVVAHHSFRDGQASEVVLDPVLAVDGFLADVLAGEGVVVREVPNGGRLGELGSVEHLARSQVLGVPVKFGADDKRFLIGALVLVDKLPVDDNRAEPTRRFDHEEWQIASSYAAILGAVLGARKSAELRKEMSMAEAIQRQILPPGPPQLAGFDVAATYAACGAVGGDYYDYLPLADGRQLVVVADVSGHNLASGMVMVGARAMLRTLASVYSEPQRVFESLAASMFADLSRTERFLTAAAVAVRPDDGSVEYVCAGHNDLLVYRAASDRVESVASDSTILGFLPAPDYPTRTIQLLPGDCLLLYTDGITEATDETDEMFGDDRLRSVFAQLATNPSARLIVDGIVQALDQFRRGRVGSDDVTAVVVRYHGKGRRR